ncbi:MAG: molybdopterin biosynthesis protein [Clostridiaceae bacterium]
MMNEKRYIGNTREEEARSAYLGALELQPATEQVPVTESLGRVTAKAVQAVLSSPAFNCAAMDGAAVVSKVTRSARPQAPVRLVEGDNFVFVNTGNPVEEPFDAVIMKEDLIQDGQDLLIYQPAITWQHVRPIGEDIVATEMILPRAHVIRPFDLGSLIAGGISELEVIRRPVVSILPTGTELVETPEEVTKGHIPDSNSWMLKGLVEEAGGVVRRWDPIPDEYDRIKSAIAQAAVGSDLVLVGAGSSAGTKDFTARAVAELGEVIVHGIAIKPGKPSILGKVGTTPVIGIPGYPVSSYISFQEFAAPVLARLTARPVKDTFVEAILTADVHSSLKNKEFIRVSLHYEDGIYRATPSRSGAGVSMSLVRSDGIGIIEQQDEGLSRGETIRVRLLRTLDEVHERLTITGSHDICIDLLGDRMPINSTHVGSMGGVLAMRNQEALLAPVHVLEETDGSYNLHLLKKYFPGNTHVLLRGPGRIQGLMVKKGNPDGIHSIHDLTRPDVLFMNRQRGSGTRIFVDHLLRQEAINPEQIQGYEREATTHTTVAAAVAQGNATAGAGVLSAALALNLDFIPLGQEHYDFLVARDNLEDERIQAFLGYLRSDSFRLEVEERGGFLTVVLGMILEADDVERSI